MGIHDRDYYRGDEPSGWSLGGSSSSAAVQLIAANVVVFIACAIGEIKIHEALRDVAIVLIPMLLVLLLVILLPELILALPRLLMPKFL